VTAPGGRLGYMERPSRIHGALVWHRPDASRPARILPDGCMDVIWASDGELFVAGPDTRAYVHQGRSGTSLTGIRLPPGLGPVVLGAPAHLLRDRRVDLGAESLAAPHDRPWGIYSAYFRDPDGHLWEIVWNPGFEIAAL
jgi:catechol 2,3-dioxygenase-like lactoylglutathione lyase family enzyme